MSGEIIESNGERVEDKKNTLTSFETIEVVNGVPAPKNMEQFKMVAAAWIDGGMVPKAYKKWTQVLAGIDYAVGMGLPSKPSSLRNIAVIGGQPSLWGELPLEMVRKSGQLEFFDEFLIDENENRIEYVTDWQNIFSAVCIVQRKGFHRRTFTWTRFQAEKAIHGIETIWKGYYDVMMKRKCRAIALKDEFTDIIGTRMIAEHDFHITPEAPEMEKRMKDVGPTAMSDLDLV